MSTSIADCANAAYMGRSAHMAAMGFQSASTADLSVAADAADEARNGGMINPRLHRIDAGSTLFRFARDEQGAVSGGWWLDQQNMAKVERWAGDRQLKLPIAIRILCSVPTEWSGLLVQVRAVTAVALAAYLGPGGAARNRHGTERYFGNDAIGYLVEQLYVPGLASVAGAMASSATVGRFSVEDGRSGAPVNQLPV